MTHFIKRFIAGEIDYWRQVAEYFYPTPKLADQTINKVLINRLYHEMTGFNCPKCGKLLKSKVNINPGQRVACPKCRHRWEALCAR